MFSKYKRQLRNLKQLESQELKLAQIRNKLVDYLAFKPALKPIYQQQVLLTLFKPAYVVAVCLVLLALGATSLAATQAMPSEPLYPFKRAMEKLQVFLIANPQDKLQAHLVLAERRIQEAEQVAVQSNSPAVMEALDEYQEEIKEMNKVAVIQESVQTNLLASARQSLIRQQERLAKLANRVSQAAQVRRLDLEDRVVEALNDNNDKELEIFNKVVSWAPAIAPLTTKTTSLRGITEINIEEQTGKSLIAPVPQIETVNKVEAIMPQLPNEVPILVQPLRQNLARLETEQKIKASEQLLLTLQVPLTRVTDTKAQEKLGKLYERAQNALQQAQEVLSKTIDGSEQNYLPAYRQALNAYKLALELQVRLNYVNGQQANPEVKGIDSRQFPEQQKIKRGR